MKLSQPPEGDDPPQDDGQPQDRWCDDDGTYPIALALRRDQWGRFSRRRPGDPEATLFDN
jgi:hypothetical protein